MAKSRRLAGLLQALRVAGLRRPQSLPVISKRLTTSLRSIIARKTGQSDPEMLKDGAADEGMRPLSAIELSEVPPGEIDQASDDDDVRKPTSLLSPSLPPEIGGKRKRSYEHDDIPAQERNRPELRVEDENLNQDALHRKTSTKERDQGIIDWVNEQPVTTDFATHDTDASPLPSHHALTGT